MAIGRSTGLPVFAKSLLAAMGPGFRQDDGGGRDCAAARQPN